MSRPTSARLRLARYGFTDVAGAAKLLGPEPDGLGLWDDVDSAPIDAAAGDVLTALGSSADPYLAVRQLHRVEEAARRIAPDAGPLAAMRSDAGVRSALAAVLGASITLGDDLVADPTRWHAVRDLAWRPDEPFHRAPVDSPAQLRSAYRAALLRIAAADLTQAAGVGGAVGSAELVDQTMHNLSQLADATMAAALRLAEAERGAAPCLAVIAMGKCGGRELNYVSDVDVIFVCDSTMPISSTLR